MNKTMPFNRTTRRSAVAVVAALATLAACGGGKDKATDTKTDSKTATATSADAGTMSGTDSAASTATDSKMSATAAADASKVSGTLNGAGSSAQAAAMQAWQSGFQALAPNTTINYDPVGSGGGREQFLAGGVEFAGSDAALSDEEYATSKTSCAGDQGAVDLPHYVSPIAVAYNLPSLEGTTLNLTPDVIAGIFANKITKWNDAAIAKDNPDAKLPDTAINPVHRSDKSGTSKNFTDYLSQAAPDTWTWGALEAWDTDGPGGGEGADGTSGVVAAIGAGEGSIGYADLSQVGSLPVAAVGVAGSFVPPSAEAAAKVVESSTKVEGRSEFDYSIKVNRTPDSADIYPIVLVSYHIVCLQYDTQEKVDLVKAFMTYVGSPEGQAIAQASAGSAPISATVQTEVAKAVDAITVAG